MTCSLTTTRETNSNLAGGCLCNGARAHAADLAPVNKLEFNIASATPTVWSGDTEKAPGRTRALVAGGPDTAKRWIGTGWTVYNNKGKPVRQFEPFFTDTHRFEFDAAVE